MLRIARRKVGSTLGAITARGPGRIAMPSASINAATSGSARRSASGRITTRKIVDTSLSRAARSGSPRMANSRAEVSIAAKASGRGSTTPTKALPGSRQRRIFFSSSQHSNCGKMSARDPVAVQPFSVRLPTRRPFHRASDRCGLPQGIERGGTIVAMARSASDDGDSVRKPSQSFSRQASNPICYRQPTHNSHSLARRGWR